MNVIIRNIEPLNNICITPEVMDSQWIHNGWETKQNKKNIFIYKQ